MRKEKRAKEKKKKLTDSGTVRGKPLRNCQIPGFLPQHEHSTLNVWEKPLKQQEDHVTMNTSIQLLESSS